MAGLIGRFAGKGVVNERVVLQQHGTGRSRGRGRCDRGFLFLSLLAIANPVAHIVNSRRIHITPLISRADIARQLGVPPKTLNDWLPNANRQPRTACRHRLMLSLAVEALQARLVKQ